MATTAIPTDSDLLELQANATNDAPKERRRRLLG